MVEDVFLIESDAAALPVAAVAAPSDVVAAVVDADALAVPAAEPSEPQAINRIAGTANIALNARNTPIAPSLVARCPHVA